MTAVAHMLILTSSNFHLRKFAPSIATQKWMRINILSPTIWWRIFQLIYSFRIMFSREIFQKSTCDLTNFKYLIVLPARFSFLNDLNL
jgi:hypothetical protein